MPPASTKRITSPLVTLPSRPLAGMLEASSPCSSTRRRAAGPSLPDPPVSPDRVLDASAVPAVSSGAAASVSAAGSAGAAASASPSSSTARTSPAVTVVPSSMRISLRIPAAGAGTSRTTLSVSRSTRFSSRSTRSPALLCHPTSVASATDSGSWGTLTSILMPFS